MIELFLIVIPWRVLVFRQCLKLSGKDIPPKPPLNG